MTGNLPFLTALWGPRPRSRGIRALGLTLMAGLLCLPGCLSRSGTGPQLPYVKPAQSVPQVDPAPLQLASRLQEMENELHRLRDRIERLQASGSDGTAVRGLQDRVSFIEKQLGIEPIPQSPDRRPMQPAVQPPMEPSGAPQMGPGTAQPPPGRAATRAPAPPPPPPVEIRNTPLAPDEQAYRDAYSAFRAGSLDQSIAMFEEFLKKYPKSPLASDAIYWIGETRFAHGRFDEAVLQFDRVIKEFPGSKKEVSALLKQGQCFEKMKDQRSARIIFEKLVAEYPHTAQARIAAAALKSRLQE